ncbi:MAG: hypothetical protein HUK00_06615 [Bacteroidaceae bacterium]|nr:hypothetical protein [Bacteroidaceae bacterium]
MKKIFSLLAMASAMMSIVSCSDDADLQSGAHGGISFSLTGDNGSTRTQYASNDWRQIEWKVNDTIKLVCAQTQAPDGAGGWISKTSADYVVYEPVAHSWDYNGTTITNYSKAKIQPSTADVLYWGENKSDGTPQQHTFYAGYGEDITITTDGEATCMYQVEQTLYENTARTDRSEWVNMKQAYMVAKKVTTPVDDVDLHFKPIMTTLDIEVPGATDHDITVKAMEIDLPENLDVIYTSGTNAYFGFNITDADNGGTVKEIASASRTAEKLIFTFETEKKIEQGKSIHVVAILPPITIGAADKIKITVDATDLSNVTELTGKAIGAGNKVALKAKNWQAAKTPQEGVDYVNMGPAGYWAKCNLGASSEEECGDYYGWGCTVPYATSSYVDWAFYFKEIGGTGTTIADCGTAKDPLQAFVSPNETRIDNTKWDAAHVRLGDKWRMPSEDDFIALRNTDNYTWVWYGTTNKYKGACGYLVTYKIDTSKSIFLPAAGIRKENALLDFNTYGIWFSSSSYSPTGGHKNPAWVCHLHVGKSLFSIGSLDVNRLHGRSIRPVYDPSLP